MPRSLSRYTSVAFLQDPSAGVDARDVLAWREGVNAQLTGAVIEAIAQHRDWGREAKAQNVLA